MKQTFQIAITHFLLIFIFSTITLSQPLSQTKIEDRQKNKINALISKYLFFIDPGVTPFSGYRWRDVAGYFYSDAYRLSYGYDDTEVQVQVTFEQSDLTLHGQLNAANLKPNFAYQIKLNGIPGTVSNERIGLAGRWWREEWDGSQWTNGQNLNNKGDGSFPNPNDLVYFATYDQVDATSPTGLHYRYTGYLLLDYFITDENGDAVVDFEVNSSYHVLWNTIQRTPVADDGPQKTATVDPDPDQSAYDSDYPEATITIFGEWERLPREEIFLETGYYDCQMILTEESFHGWPGGDYTGQWAAAMGAGIQFTIEEDDPLSVQLFSFTAEAGNACVLIRWTTESEIDHAGFELLRSAQQNNGYSSISDYRSNPDLSGQGNSSVKQEYVYIDRNVAVGNSYWYYLVDVGLDGKRTYHGPLPVYLMHNSGLNCLTTAIPAKLILYPNFPNPFNAHTVIRFDIPGTGQVMHTIQLAIYNSSGQIVRMLYQGNMAPGTYEIRWDGKSDRGIPLASGVYFVVLNLQEQKKVGKMILLK